MRNLLKILFFFLLVTQICFGQGTIRNVIFYSNSLMMNRNVQIYLPSWYNPIDTLVRYPVIYFLHGATVNQTGYTELFNIYNNLIAAHIISPLIVVKPDGSTPPWGGSYYANSELYGNFEDYIVYDLADFIDSAYNTIPSRETRAIMGHSMGAFGSMYLALKHPDVYCSVVANSGPLDFKHFSDWIPSVQSENGGAPVHFYNPSAGMMTYLFYTMAGAFSPNINNTPYPVDFPLDSLGNWKDSVWSRWSLRDPVILARNITQSSDLAIFFDCGIYDEFKLYNFMSAFADSLDNLGLTYVYQTYNGNHTNQLVNRFNIAFRFLDSVMSQLPVSSEEFTHQPESFSLFQNFPNPFNSSSIIKYSIPKTSQVTLKMFNTLGEEIETLVNEEKIAGNYEVNFNANSLPSGVYFYQLRAEDFVETNKMLYLK
jgi:S-formylglutathione hydrolase FrmB